MALVDRLIASDRAGVGTVETDESLTKGGVWEPKDRYLRCKNRKEGSDGCSRFLAPVGISDICSSRFSTRDMRREYTRTAFPRDLEERSKSACIIDTVRPLDGVPDTLADLSIIKLLVELLDLSNKINPTF
jgi:hypothetical protein